MMYLFISADTMNTQVHDTTKQTPYELVFGQPPRAIFVLDVNFRGQLDEDVLKQPSLEVTKDKDEDDVGKKRWMRGEKRSLSRKKRRMRRKQRWMRRKKRWMRRKKRWMR